MHNYGLHLQYGNNVICARMKFFVFFADSFIKYAFEHL